MQKIDIDRSSSDFKVDTPYRFDAGVGLSENTIRYLSEAKQEPEHLLKFRLKAFKTFNEKSLPSWVPKVVDEIDFQAIRYYLAHDRKVQNTWEDVPENIKTTFERLGIPEKEKNFLAGVEAQFDSEFAYSKMHDKLTQQGVIFTDSSEGLKNHYDIFGPYFSKIVPVDDNRFSALNSAVFSGGSFIYVPPGVKVMQPLQAYFRINAERFGQFERTLIIVDEGAELTYMEGCTAPTFDSHNLHSAVVELVALKGAKLQYITVQNWANNVFNLVTKRGMAAEEAQIRWIDCNIGSRITMKYPGIVLKGPKAKGEVLSISMATTGQVQDTGAKMIHLADETTSNIVSKSVSMGEGVAGYRGKIFVQQGLKGCKNRTECASLLLNTGSKTNAYPRVDVCGNLNSVSHEASVSTLDEEKIFYMQQRGLKRNEAISMAVNGFVNDLVQEFPLEYSVELKRLIDLEVSDSVS